MNTAVFLLNFGGPRTLADVAPFMRNLTGRDAPPQAIEAVMARYRAIGGGSPLASITEQQAAMLSAATGKAYPVKAAFRYSRPSIEESINECYTSKVEHIVFLVMSPYYTSRTVGGYMSAAEAYLAYLPYRPRITFIHSWYTEPLFTECWARKIEEEGHPRESFYLFSAHSLPESLSDEPYKRQIEETVTTIASALRLSDYATGWQSVPDRSDESWIGPTVESMIDRLAGTGKQVVEVPVGFVSDHLETLYDIDVLHRRHAAAKDVPFTRIASLNTYPPFIAALKAVLEKHLQDRT